jgi:hypothetical protein
VLLAPKLAGGYTTFLPTNVKMAENRGANLQRCGDRGPKSSTPCHCNVPKVVLWSSACQLAPFPAQKEGKDGNIQKTRRESCIPRGPRAFVPIKSAGQCLALTWWNHAVSGVPLVMMSPVQRLQMGGYVTSGTRLCLVQVLGTVRALARHTSRGLYQWQACGTCVLNRRQHAV